MNCPKCTNGKLKITVVGQGDMELPCVYCNGSGIVTAAQKTQIKEMDDSWCRCGNPSGNVNHYRAGTDIYDCADCGGTLQVG